MLGFARRAGALAVGTGATIGALEKGKAVLLLVSQDASPRTWEKISAQRGEIPLVRYGRKEELGKEIGWSGDVAVLAVTQAHFAQNILRLTERKGLGE